MLLEEEVKRRKKLPVMPHYEKFASIIWQEFRWNTCKEYQKSMQNLKSILVEFLGLFTFYYVYRQYLKIWFNSNNTDYWI